MFCGIHICAENNNDHSHLLYNITSGLTFAGPLLQVTQPGPVCDPQSGVQRLSERGLDSVHQLQLHVRDAVEGQNTCLMIQVHTGSGGLRRRHCSLLIVVPENFIVFV